MASAWPWPELFSGRAIGWSSPPSTRRRCRIVTALDSTKPDDIARIVRETKDRFGSVDVLVNTAGVGYIPAVEEGDGKGIGRQIDINFSDRPVT
jgi:NAD(P)-dependent dehydrogenase (short-subunit alcohol dehydrogenase family)